MTATLEKSSAQMFIEKAKLAEQVERYEDMAQAMRQFIEATDAVPDREQRQLLSVAYKSKVTPLRNNLRHLFMEATKGDHTEIQQHVINDYCLQIENALRQVCGEVLAIIEKILSKVTDDNHENKVFYLKMRADYYRYMAEMERAIGNKESQVVKGIIENAHQAYQQAMNIAEVHLPPTNPVRLGLSLNYSVFYYEIIGSTSMACKIAKESFDTSVNLLSKLDMESDAYKDTSLILQLLQDNLTLWDSQQYDKGNEADGAQDEKDNSGSGDSDQISPVSPL